MTDQLLNILALAPGPQTATELRDALKRGGLKVEEFQVLQELRRIQNEGFVRLEGTRWRLLKMPPDITVSPPQRMPAPMPAPGGPVSRISAAGSVRPTPGIALPPEPAGRYALFRRLCRYYMDCLLQEEAPQLRAYVDNEDDTWIALGDVPWGRLAANGNFAVSLAREQAPFNRNRIRRGEEECIYVCYPLMLVRPEGNSGFVVPLFAQPMQAEWRAGVIHLDPDGPIAVNGAWLEYRFRQRAEREAFLRAMGFLNPIGDDEEDQGERQVTGPKDFARLAPDAAHFLHDPDRHAEPIEPMQLNRAVDWRRAKPGLYNAAILTLGPRLRYTRSLLRDLRHIEEKFSDEDLDGTAVAALFPHDQATPEDPGSHPDLSPSRAVPAGSDPSTQRQVAKASASPVGLKNDMAPIAESVPRGASVSPAPPSFLPDQLAQTRLLHPSQRTAVVNALSEAVSVVTGPPGTGKSEVVASMLVNQLLRGSPALFASKNHQALEAVLPRLNGVVDGGDLIIQTANRDLAQRQNYLTKMQTLLSRPPRPDAAQGEAFQRRFVDLFNRQQTALDDLKSLEQARDEYGRLNEQLAALRKKLPLTVQSDDSIASWPTGMTSERLSELEAELRAALRPPASLLERLWRWFRRSRDEATRQAARDPFLGLPNPFTDGELPDATAMFDAWAPFFVIWKDWAEAARVLAVLRECERRVAQLPSAEECNRRLAEAQRAIEETTRDWMAWAAGGMSNPLTPAEREALANLRAGIQNWGADRFAKELRLRFPIMLRAFPLWSVSNLSARSALPPVPGLFDLVIVDEASQCDIASVVPLLARSRRAVFAGDPMQLQHVSTLDPAVEQSLLQQHGLTDGSVQRFTYRVNSAFDLAYSSATVPATARVRLDLHFRSHDLIADYCNEAFYARTLHVVTTTERLNIPAGVRPGIHWTHVVGKLEPGTTGVWCADEIAAIQRELGILAASDYRGTIGVVTPFRQQMIRIKDALESDDSLSASFSERVRLLAATAHGFQGDERDLILFSLCGGPEMPAGATIFLKENPNLFNVAVSRARAVLHIVGNRDWALGCGVSFIEKLALRTMPGWVAAHRPQQELYQSPWEKVLADALRAAGVEVVPQHPVAGRFLDLGVLAPHKIDLEVDGESVHRTAGGGRKDDDHWRDLQLESLGWRVCRFWVYQLREDLPGCVERVVRQLGKHDAR